MSSLNKIGKEININTENDQYKQDLEDSYQSWTNTALFDIAFDVIEYCRTESPLLLKNRASLNAVLNVLSEYVDVNCPFNFIKQDDQSDEELLEESLIYEK